MKDSKKKKREKFTFIDLFAGIGGFRMALESLGGECVFSSEINKDAQQTYADNFGHTPSGDITKIKNDEVPAHDILCAGFPCQAFSKSGHQRGFEDARGTLFYEIARIAKFHQTPVLFLENVANLKGHDGGQTYLTMKTLLEEIGYQVSEQILNSKDFGLAQNRERIIIVASLKGIAFDFSKVKRSKPKSIKDILDKVGPYEYLAKSEYTLLPANLQVKQKSGLIFAGYRNRKIRTVGAETSSINSSRVHKQPNRIYHTRGTHPTLPSQETSGRFWIYNGKSVRKLTLEECYALQGFPKTFKRSKKTSAAYLQIGNSVSVPLIREVGREIVVQLIGGNDE